VLATLVVLPALLGPGSAHGGINRGARRQLRSTVE